MWRRDCQHSAEVFQFILFQPLSWPHPKAGVVHVHRVQQSTSQQAAAQVDKHVHVHTQVQKAQLLALQNIGLSELRVADNISKEPDLLARDFAGGVALDQVYFLTHVVGKQVTEVLVALPGILKLSLFERRGRRWSFYSLHCQGQTSVLNTRVKPPDAEFAQKLKHSSLDARRLSSGLTNYELFCKHRLQWQQGRACTCSGSKRRDASYSAKHKAGVSSVAA